MSSSAECCAETDFIRDQFANLAEVQSVHILFRNNICYITVAVPTKDYALEDRIYDVQYAIAQELQAQGFLFDVNIVILAGRRLEDIVTSVGQPVLQRAA